MVDAAARAAELGAVLRDAFGETPFSYQPELIEPIGRTVGITIRKLFLPRRFIRRAAGAGRNAGS